MTEILGAPQRETGKEELVKSLLAPRPKAHPRRGNPLSSLHRTPPRPSGSHRKPAGTLSRRLPYSNFARTCKVVAKSPFSLTPGAARSLLGQDRKGPRRAPRGGERRRKGAGAVFAAGGNGAERTLRRRQWGAHPRWTSPPAGAESPEAAERRPNRFPGVSASGPPGSSPPCGCGAVFPNSPRLLPGRQTNRPRPPPGGQGPCNGRFTSCRAAPSCASRGPEWPCASAGSWG